MTSVRTAAVIPFARPASAALLAGPAAIDCLFRVQDLRNPRVAGHGRRVGKMAVELGMALGLDGARIAALGAAAGLHDVGKMAIADAILDKPAPLTAEEWTTMKGHCQAGEQVLRGHGDPVLAMAEQVALLHHEACDGTGYPFGLTRHEIPIEARITSVCDVYDALRADRPYRSGFDHAEACDIILKGDGRTAPTQFDPDVLAAFGRAGDVLARIAADPVVL